MLATWHAAVVVGLSQEEPEPVEWEQEGAAHLGRMRGEL